MDSREGQASSNQQVQAFDTKDILLHLFKISLKKRGLPELNSDELLALDAQIGMIDHAIHHYLSPEEAIEAPQTKLNAIKTLLIAAKDSPTRKDLVATVTESDGKLISLNTQGENLAEDAKKLTTLFWDKVIEASLKKTSLEPQTLNQVKKDLGKLTTATQPFIDGHEALLETISKIGAQVAAMTGKQLSDALTMQQPAKTTEPKASG